MIGKGIWLAATQLPKVVPILGADVGYSLSKGLTFATDEIAYTLRSPVCLDYAPGQLNSGIPLATRSSVVRINPAQGVPDAFDAPEFPVGSFSISDWSGYPSGLPKPEGPFRLIEGAEYEAARDAANLANSPIRRERGLVGQPVDIHEINPVKFGGSPIDPANKVILPRDFHRQQVTPWWNQLQKSLSE